MDYDSSVGAVGSGSVLFPSSRLLRRECEEPDLPPCVSYLHLAGEVGPVQEGDVTHHQLHLGFPHQAEGRLENGGLSLPVLLAVRLLLASFSLLGLLALVGTLLGALRCLLLPGQLVREEREK